MDKNQIFITSGTEYKKMTKELLEKADLQSHSIKRCAAAVVLLVITPTNDTVFIIAYR